MNITGDNRNPLIAVPAFNEERNIIDLLKKLKPWKKDVVVIDDGSTDNTVNLVKESGFRLFARGFNAGIAGFYSTATDIAVKNNYTRLIALDADGQHDPAYIPAFIDAMEHHDLVSGDRFYNLKGIPESKIASNLFAVLLFKDMLNITLPDVACGFRGFKIAAFPENNDDEGFGIIYDMLVRFVQAVRKTCFIRMPAIYHSTDGMNTNIPEILGLLTTITRYNPSPEVLSVMNAVSNKSGFRITLSGCSFTAVLQEPGAYRFETDMARATQRFKEIHKEFSQTANEHENR